MEDKILRVRMFGGFSLNYGDREIELKSIENGRVMQLLAVILFESREGIRREKIIERLYSSETCADPGNNMRVSLHRLKKALTEAGLPGEDCIKAKKKVYFWDTDEIKLELDVWEFEGCLKMAEQAQTKTEQVSYLKKACDLYQGEFIPQMLSDGWVVAKSLYFQELYFDALRTLRDYWEQEQEYEQMLYYCSAAAELYPYEEWQIYRIDCLIRLGRSDEAMAVYRQTTEFIFEELGVEPSEEMLKRFQAMSSQIKYSVKAVDRITEKLREEEKNQGAYYCMYPGFADIYRYVVRRLERSGKSAYLMICVIEDKDGNMPKIPEKTEDEFRTAIQSSLRREDVFCKFGQNQYLIMMQGIKQEDCAIVSSRIDLKFNRLHWGRDKKISYYISTVLEREEDYPAIPFKRKKAVWKEDKSL